MCVNRTLRVVWLVLLGAVAIGGCRPADKVDAESKIVDWNKLRAGMRMPWSPSAAEGGGYIRRWLMCGPFPSPELPKDTLARIMAERQGEPNVQFLRSGHNVDYLRPAGGEAAARPVEGQTVKRPDGKTVAWRAFKSKETIVWLHDAFGEEGRIPMVAYAYTTIHRSEGGDAYLTLGSDDSAKVYLNGKCVHDAYVARGVTPDEDLIPLTLAKGVNTLLVKVENVLGGGGFALRFLTKAQLQAIEPRPPRPRLERTPDKVSDALVVTTDDIKQVVSVDTQPILVEVVAAGGRVVGRAEAARGDRVSFKTRKWPDGPYDVRVSRVDADDYRMFTYFPWYKGDFIAAVRKLLDETDKLPKGSDKPSDLRAGLMRRLMLDRLGGDPRTDEEAAAKLAAPSAECQAILMEYRENAMGEGACVRSHGSLRLAWRDPIDDSPQFARAYLPPGYDPKKKWPLVVSLHGYNPANPPYERFWSVVKRYHRQSERHGVILVEPHGRGNAGYEGIGETDVLTALRVVREKFSVDDDRTYLIGYSMGGGGTMHVGTRHPDKFAAISPIIGVGGDFRIWTDTEEIDKLTDRELFHRERWSGFAQADALVTTPVFIAIGDKDEFGMYRQARYLSCMLSRWGYNVRYWEQPGKGHWLPNAEYTIIPWLLTHRLNRSPRRVRVRAARLESAHAHWVTVLQRDAPFAFVHVDAQVTDPTTIRVSTANVLQVRLSPPKTLVDYTRPVRIIWNGRSFTGRKWPVTLSASGYAPGKLCKRPSLEGPMDDVKTTPFAIVVGTASKDDRMRRLCRLRAGVAADEWREWQHVMPRFFLDTEITDEQIHKYSLILFGGPDENRVTRRLIESIPLAMTPDSITIGGKTFPAKNAAVGLVYPHPLAPGRYVLVEAANSPDGMFFAGRRRGDVDFVIRDARGDIVSGCFDYNWQYSEDYIERAKQAARDKAVPPKVPKLASADIEGKRLVLSDVLPVSVSGGFRHVRRDVNCEGKPIRLGGRTYKHGLCMWMRSSPLSSASYDLGGRWRRLKAVVGIELGEGGLPDKAHRGRSRVYFVVRGDEKELYRSGEFDWATEPVEIDVGIEGVKTLELQVVNELRGHYTVPRVDWADVRIEK